MGYLAKGVMDRETELEKQLYVCDAAVDKASTLIDAQAIRIEELEALIDRAISHFDGWQRREETESIDDLMADMRKEREPKTKHQS